MTDVTLTVGGMFDGIGLLAYGLHLAGLEHRWLCEWDPWRRSILEQRFPGIPVLPDVRGVGSVEPVTCIAGGFPCKGASTAGRREGFGHPETVLWREMARAVRELRPRYVLVENVANILAIHDGAVWGEVLGDLAALGYDVVWDCIPAAAVGAPHRRDRVFAIATHADEPRADPRSPGAGEGEGPERQRVRVDVAGRERARGGELGAWGRDHAEPGDQAPTDAGRGGQPEHEELDGEWRAGIDRPFGDHALGRGVAVEWGSFGPAIRRWEAVAGPAPKPLVRRVDDRGAARVERSRLSALGDGVQVQVGMIAGAHIMALEALRSRRGAA